MILTRTKAAFLSFAATDGAELPDYSISPGALVHLPWREGATTQPYFTAGMAFRMLHRTDPAKRHTVTLMCSKLAELPQPQFFFVCNDPFLEGKNSGKPEEHVERAIDFLKLAETDPARESLRALMMGSHDKIPESSGCSFWTMLRRDPDGAGCKHVKGLLHNLHSSGALARMLDQIAGAYAEPFKSAKPKVKTVANPTALLATLERLAGANRKTKHPIMIEGPTSGGKTEIGRAFADQGFDHYEEIQGAAGMEAFDLLGGPVDYEGKFVWLDGPMTRGFRLAATDKKVLLLVDELRRIPRRERSIFLSALSPFKGKYRLRTGRAINVKDGVAEMEIIECPVANLSIVATTNSGSEYDIEDDDPAGAERWIVLFHNPDEDMNRAVLTRAAKESGFTKKAVDQLMKFRTNCLKLKEERNCKTVPSTRALCRAIGLAENEAELPRFAALILPSLIGRTPAGAPIQEQRALVEQAFENAFGVSAEAVNAA